MKTLGVYSQLLTEHIVKNYLFLADVAERTVVIQLELISMTGGINARFSQ